MRSVEVQAEEIAIALLMQGGYDPVRALRQAESVVPIGGTEDAEIARRVVDHCRVVHAKHLENLQKGAGDPNVEKGEERA